MSSTAETPELLLDLTQVQDALHVSRAHVYAEIKAGRLHAVKAGRRTLFRVADVRAYVDALPSRAATPP